MKRFFLLLGAMALFAACTNEPELDGSANKNSPTAKISGSSQGAVAGTLAVKLTPEAAQAAYQKSAATRGESTRSGIEDFDEILAQLDVESFYRIIEFDQQYEALYDKTGLNCWFRLIFDEALALDQVAQKLSTVPQVQVVEFKHKIKSLKVGPTIPYVSDGSIDNRQTRSGFSDALFADQWHLENKGGTTLYPKKISGADVNVVPAWDLCAGNSDIIVAVIDEPVQSTHPDLAANMWSHPSNPNEHGKNFYNTTGSGSNRQPTDLDWVSFDSKYSEYADHGSHVAGVIAAVNNNAIGISSIAGGGNGDSGVKIMSCQIMGYGTKGIDNDADIKAFNYAMKNGAVIAQNSWGYSMSMSESSWNYGHSMRRAAIDTFILGAGSNNPNFPNSPIAGGIVLFAAGNDGADIADKKSWPSAYAPVISVAATGWDHRPSWFTCYGAWNDISAPGGDQFDASNGKATILSTILCDDKINYADGRKTKGMYGYGFMQGTSMACPHVAGVAALGLAYAQKIGKKFTAAEYRSLLLSSVYGIDQYFVGTKTGVRSDYTSVTLNMSNYVNKMGGGGVDAFKLLLNVKGTPAIYAQQGVKTTVDMAKYFGGGNTKVKLISVKISAADLQKVGLSAVPTFSGTTLLFDCSAMGSMIFEVIAKSGDMEIKREFALVVRAPLAANGGWL